MDFSDMDDLDTAPMKSASKKVVVEQAMRCVKCAGRGSVTYGYVNIKTYPCGVCKGAGVVTQKRLDNIQRAKKAQATQQLNAAAKRRAGEEFLANNNDIHSFMMNHRDRNEFVRSLNEQLLERGSLSDKQLAALRAMMAKYADRAEARNAARTTDVGQNAAAMVAVMSAARANGYKRVILRTERFTFSAAPSNGKNAGWIYVKNEFQGYVGKISPEGKFLSLQADKQVASAVADVCKDPLAAAIYYGRKTGNCACCGRELTDKLSVAKGIGPICAEKFGFLI